MGSSTSRVRKHSAWLNQTCQRPDGISTVTRHGSTELELISLPQKQQGPHLISVTASVLVIGWITGSVKVTATSRLYIGSAVLLITEDAGNMQIHLSQLLK